MNVRELIQLLEKCDPEALVITNCPYYEDANYVQRHAEISGVGQRFSFETIKAVEIGRGDLEYMQGNGLDVIGYPREKLDDDRFEDDA